MIEREVARGEGLQIEEWSEGEGRDLLEVHLELIGVELRRAQDEVEGLHFDPEHARGRTQDAGLIARPGETAGEEQGGGGKRVGLGKAVQCLRTAQGQTEEGTQEVMGVRGQLPSELTYLSG
ncbi:hypothetical protein [Deinococcus sp. Leaf326]|uniref:hypothetical protein n=1 Tax=Deinococcus sp. Leaf326 TaxID=1736338 RepID=UPI0006FA26E3|nr:hypothetical protein [Deinococcus sp. Leaf326]KQR26992.1 hypothetical protein ASF71_18035 [Deinococcus sp. Leaf326]